MSVKIRILGSSTRPMQRVGFLKLLCAQTARTETNNLPSLGKQFVQTLLTRVRLSPPYSASIREYVKVRLTDRVYHDLRKAVLGENQTGYPVSLEIQDLYLSDPTLPSATGKLVEKDWRRYPYLGPNLDLIRRGTYSIMTRALVFLALTPKEEIAAFEQYDANHNPLRISPEQAALLLYCFIDNDAEIVHRLFSLLLEQEKDVFDEREAGDMLPEIIRQSISSFRNAALPQEDRERLGVLEKVARSIEQWKGKSYTGGGAREEFIRVRLEPYCDLGLLTKPDKQRFSYRKTAALRSLMSNWYELETTDHFLRDKFFTSLSSIYGLKIKEATDAEAKKALMEAGSILKSTLGYSPITDIGLLAGIHLLFQHRRTLELSHTERLLRAWQKEEPDIVRFTVDRMGTLAYVKFVKTTFPPVSKKVT